MDSGHVAGADIGNSTCRSTAWDGKSFSEVSFVSGKDGMSSTVYIRNTGEVLEAEVDLLGTDITAAHVEFKFAKQCIGVTGKPFFCRILSVHLYTFPAYKMKYFYLFPAYKRKNTRAYQFNSGASFQTLQGSSRSGAHQASNLPSSETSSCCRTLQAVQ